MYTRPRIRGRLDAAQRALLEQLVEQCGPRLLAYVRRMGWPMADAEDIVAETFSRAAEHAEGLERTARPDLYLLTIARNLCRDRFRRQPPMPQPFERLDATPDTVGSPTSALDDQEQGAAVAAAVAALPAPLREVLVLRFSSGLKFEEIAALLQIPLGTALSRAHAALGRLREALGVRV